MRIIRATKLAEQAAAYYVRIQGMARQHQITLEEEFDEHDTPETKYIVIMDNYLPIATCRLYPLDPAHIMLGRIVVLPEYRNRGLGRQVVAEAEEWARELGFTTAVLDSREEKMPFYAKIGYQANWNIITEGTFHCVRMTKALPH